VRDGCELSWIELCEESLCVMEELGRERGAGAALSAELSPQGTQVVLVKGVLVLRVQTEELVSARRIHEQCSELLRLAPAP
jgi:hypothetical protein